MKQIVCMSWGPAYGAEYVNRLYSMVARNITPPFRFVCLTDRASGIRDEVDCYACPELPVPPPRCNRPWRKVTLWGEQLSGLERGNALFIDLDVVITGSIDPFFEYEPERSFVVIRNWTQPDKRIGNTSVYRFRVGSHPYLLSNLIANHPEVFAKFPNSQTYISESINEMTFWPDEWCRSFKVHCIPKGLKRYFVEPALPEGTRIVAFPGLPNPPDAAAGRWPAPWYKRLYKQVRPARWVSEHWR
ncbi:MAG: hypothetical protein KF774_11520 [Planctomyces sp.]|nr:hypothetical protein [Planctomyces sp.]